jgi:2-oxoglutarate dehydrogenase E2 component (dihydrolipoamide succinyltransferase)
MIVEQKVPSPGESVTEVMIDAWLKPDGSYVEMDEVLAEIQSDKAMLTLNAEKSGKLKILIPAGEVIAVGTVACSIDTDAAAPEKVALAVVSEPKKETAVQAPENVAKKIPSPSAEKLMQEKGFNSGDISGSGRDGRITKGDVLAHSGVQKEDVPVANSDLPDSGINKRFERREKMSMLRKKVAERLVAVKNETAMLTTFNEADMSAIIELRKKYKDKFKETHDVNLGFMSFFTKACCEALTTFPSVNGRIEKGEIVYHSYVDMGIAVSTPRGLMVPVIRNAESMSLSEIEKAILGYAGKARENKLTMEDMSGGTFTITNGGVFGSMLSTPILNPPQSAILGMHNIVQRPVAINGAVEIRPIMYLALSYDHRIIDGKESVSFLVKVKEMLEDPTRMLLHI